MTSAAGPAGSRRTSPGSSAGRAVGVEPVAALRALAPRADAVSYRGLAPDGHLPLADGEADVVVTVTVLGGLVADGELTRTAAEIRRVLRPGGLLFLAESVSTFFTLRALGPAHPCRL